jgi:hypothetical protein
VPFACHYVTESWGNIGHPRSLEPQFAATRAMSRSSHVTSGASQADNSGQLTDRILGGGAISWARLQGPLRRSAPCRSPAADRGCSAPAGAVGDALIGWDDNRTNDGARVTRRRSSRGGARRSTAGRLCVALNTCRCAQLLGAGRWGWWR